MFNTWIKILDDIQKEVLKNFIILGCSVFAFLLVSGMFTSLRWPIILFGLINNERVASLGKKR
ncbi:MAG: hypothetical protein AABX08_00565 [Nanoarchaeota archaeon]